MTDAPMARSEVVAAPLGAAELLLGAADLELDTCSYVRAAPGAPAQARHRGAHTKYCLYGAPKNHDHYGLSIFCTDKR